MQMHEISIGPRTRQDALGTTRVGERGDVSIEASIVAPARNYIPRKSGVAGFLHALNRREHPVDIQLIPEGARPVAEPPAVVGGDGPVHILVSPPVVEVGEMLRAPCQP